ncbi:hypothetical protein [Nitrospira lenta]|uniref:Uncharacterized protein n=1 Tax=Nitrospira lenta TaxID=1436998 RepID=A0A330L9B0_9BACT|nr:hypothetical protein [Nitrospira lenta]SPP65859.1 conserved exported hypothetical protein [Nitrospira lenta]
MRTRGWLVVLSMLVVSGVAAAASYDPMDDLVSTAKKEINAKEAIEKSKDRVLNDPRREKMEKGFWQFFQGKSDAKPGEYCTAVYWQHDQMITVVGPGGEYRGALLGFVAVEPKPTFPRPDNPKEIQKVKVTLTQGADPAATITAFNRTIADFADEIQFAVPTIDAALAGMEEKLNFKIEYQGSKVFELEWHSGLAARDMLKRCLKGENVTGKEVL